MVCTRTCEKFSKQQEQQKQQIRISGSRQGSDLEHYHLCVRGKGDAFTGLLVHLPFPPPIPPRLLGDLRPCLSFLLL